MRKHIFITGTDTDCGKTLITRGLMHLCHEQGLITGGMKPVASGGIVQSSGVLQNSDALSIQALCSNTTAYPLINPYCFEPAVAPHLAAALCDQTIQLNTILRAFKSLADDNECLLVEGVGGWRVPLQDELNVSGLCQALQLPALLVVGMKLGCINHALLTAEAILADGVALAGWVANCVDPEMQLLDENIATLKQQIAAPLLGVVPFVADENLQQVSAHLSLPPYWVE